MRRIARKAALGGAGALALFACVACDQPGRILVAVGTDFVVPRDVHVLRARVTGPDGASDMHTFSLVAADTIEPGTNEFTMPLSFVVTPRGDDSTRTSRIVIEAFRDAESDPVPRVRATRTVRGFIEGKTVLLPVFLASSCEGIPCPPEQTCDFGACVPDGYAATTLEVVTTPEAELRALGDLADGGRQRDGGTAPGIASVELGASYGPATGNARGWAVDKLLDDNTVVVGGDYDTSFGALPPADSLDGALLLDTLGDGTLEPSDTIAGGAGTHELVTSLYSQNDGRDGTAFVAGLTNSGSVTWHGRASGAPGGPGVFVGQLLSAADGRAIGWQGAIRITTSLPDPNLARPVDVAAGPGTVFIVTSGQGFELETGAIPRTDDRGFVLAAAASGEDRAGTPLDPSDDQMLEQDHLVLPTALSGRLYAVDTGDGILSPAINAVVGGESGPDAYAALVAYDGMGGAGSLTATWEKHIACTVEARVLAVAFDEATHVAYAVGEFSGMLSADGVSVTATGSAVDGFAAALDTSAGGRVLWLRSFSGGAGTSRVMSAVAIDLDGHVWVGGAFQGTLMIGTMGPLSGASGKDLFVSILDATTGDPIQLFTWPGVGGDDEVLDLHAIRDPSSRFVYATGYVTDTVDVGPTTIGALGAEQAFAIRFLY